jgi:hypothetical protein
MDHVKGLIRPMTGLTGRSCATGDHTGPGPNPQREIGGSKPIGPNREVPAAGREAISHYHKNRAGASAHTFRGRRK